MPIGMFVTGAIYSMWYNQWQTNTKIYAFIMYGGPGTDKVHALNIGARQLGVVDRAKIVRVIVKLAKVNTSTKYNGALLYRIFKRYLPLEIKKCYRTYFRSFITRAALINYGLNNKDEFTDLELKFQDEALFRSAKADFIIKMIDLYTKRGVQKTTVEDTFAEPIDTTTTRQPSTGTGTRPGTRPGTTPIEPDDGGDDGGPEGYY